MEGRALCSVIFSLVKPGERVDVGGHFTGLIVPIMQIQLHVKSFKQFSVMDDDKER
jgi:hypothetical protein